MTDLLKLAAPFAPADVEWRVQSCGQKGDKIWARCLAYITNRAVMQRLDDVCGPENWRNEFRHVGNTEASTAVLCGISIRVQYADPDGVARSEWVTKWDGAEYTDVEAVKGGLSGSMKRAAVQWGIGRYLHQLEEGFATVRDNGANYGKLKDNTPFRWDPPALPTWALPVGNSAGVKSATVVVDTAGTSIPASGSAKASARQQPAPASPATTTQLERLRFLGTDSELPAVTVKAIDDALAAGLTTAKADEWIKKIETHLKGLKNVKANA